MTDPTTRLSSQRGFSVIEVVIAALVFMTVAAAIGLATVGGGKLRGAVRLQAALTDAGKRVQEDIVTDRSWMDGCQTLDSECRLEGHVDADTLELEDVDGKVTLESAGATPLDSRVDGEGEEDADGLVPDYYRVRIVIRPSADVASRYGTTPSDSERTIVTTIDRRGDQAFGSLSIEVCRVMNQSDERMSIQGCAPTGASSIREADCAPLAAVCRSTFSWVSGAAAHPTERSPFVVMDRVSASSLDIRLTNATGWSATAASAKVGTDGRLQFQNVPAGEVTIQGLPSSIGARTERWRSKELPAFLGAPGEPGSRVVVEPGVRSRALVMYRPSLTDGVDLYFERRTRTRHLTGPKSGYNLVVPKWARTHDYQGVQAEKICEALGTSGGDFRFNVMWCEGQHDGPGRNCVTVVVGLDDYVKDPNGMYFIDEGNLGDITPGQEANFPPEIRRSKVTHHGLDAVITCTWYWEEYFTTYYSLGGTTPRIRAGAAQAATYSLSPMPDNRYVDMDGAIARSVVPQCRVPARSQCGPSSDAYPTTLRTMAPGLNTGLTASNDGAGMSSDEAARLNSYWGASPAAAWSTMHSSSLWVRPDGVIQGSNGGRVSPGTPIRIRGEGECYWTSPFFPGESEGSCDPCRPLWKPGQTARGCSLLTRVEWKRHAKETRKYLPLPGMPGTTTREEPIEGKHDVINFNPPYVCSSPIPQVIGGCNPMQGGGGGGNNNVPNTKHRSPGSGGAGGVKSHAVTQPAVA